MFLLSGYASQRVDSFGSWFSNNRVCLKTDNGEAGIYKMHSALESETCVELNLTCSADSSEYSADVVGEITGNVFENGGEFFRVLRAIIRRHLHAGDQYAGARGLGLADHRREILPGLLDG